MTADITASLRFRRDSLAGWRTVRIASWSWLLRPDFADDLLADSVCDPEAPPRRRSSSAAGTGPSGG